MNEFRIISLCPSTTFTLCDLGLESNIVGRTRFCIHPDSIKKVSQIGGTKNLNLEKIKALSPSHIIFNREENNLIDLEALKTIAKVIESTPTNIDEMYDSIRLLAMEFNQVKKATTIVTQIQDKIREIKSINYKSFSYVYLIWNKPIYTVGPSTFIQSVLKLFSAKNAIETISKDRYPIVTKEDLLKLNADILFLSSEPYPFSTKHIPEYKDLAKNVALINGEDTSWHGSFILQSIDRLERYFKALQAEL